MPQHCLLLMENIYDFLMVDKELPWASWEVMPEQPLTWSSQYPDYHQAAGYDIICQKAQSRHKTSIVRVHQTELLWEAGTVRAWLSVQLRFLD